MAAIIFNKVPGKHLMVEMDAAVGRGASNKPHDVRLVQAVLNAVGVAVAKPLFLDGLAGPLTVGAIEGFQRKTLGFADGRVDVGGKTINALLEALQRSSRAPPAIKGLGAPPGQFQSALVGPFESELFGRESSWRLSNSRGFSGGVSFFGASVGQFLVEEEADFEDIPGGFKPRKLLLSFSVVGVGLSALPAGVSEGRFDFPSKGSKIFLSPNFSKPDLEPSDFAGSISILELAGGFGGDGGMGSISRVYWGLNGRTANARMLAVGAGTPQAGITFYFGRVTNIERRD